MTLLSSPAMTRLFVAAVAGFALAAAGACNKKDDSTGLPPAQEWGADPGNLAPAAQGANPHAAMGANPHAGMGAVGGATGAAGADPSANPHAGLGLDPQGNPIAPGADEGGGGSPDVTKLGLQSPDPNRAIDPSHRIAGTIEIDPKLAAHAQAGGTIFVIVKRPDASGNPSGTPLAVDKLTYQPGAVAFTLGEAQAMVAGTELVGDVIVTARYDQDGDAISKQPGDVIGQARVTIPADHVKIVLGQVLE